MENRSTITEKEFNYAQKVISEMADYFSSRVVGQEELKFALVAAVIADGHVLIESVPGLAKTTAAKAVANSVDGKFSRIQCTPDLLPSDIVGTQVFDQKTGEFETILGPVFANFVLLDEINRSSAKTQSAMLEAMQEKQVTIGGTTYPMPDDVFIVFATQNPIEQEGTYPLSEAQTDRFMLKETITYPTPAEEVEVLSRIESGAITAKRQAKLSIQDVDKVQDIVEKVYVDDSIKSYISEIVNATRDPQHFLSPATAKYVRMGASPRASIAFLRVAKAVALMYGRNYVIPEDVKAIRHQVLRHRIQLSYAAAAEGITVENVIDELVSGIRTP
ncbi:MAG: MoxR family ATPase [Firmicutes bacterium]|nr:MoxR family ATPase [Bacillota bacterium]